MLLALAQIASAAAEVRVNVEHHVRAVASASAAGARLVLFPELSLTGYELDAIAADSALALSVDDDRLLPLRRECRRQAVTAVVGAPTFRAGCLHLSALVVDEAGDVSAYDKRHLFGRESELFTPGRTERVLSIDGLRIALGICFDLSDETQVMAAAQADAWLLGMLLSPGGYQADAERAADVARRHGIAVAMANHAAPTGGWVGAGRSGLWCPEEEPVTAGTGPGVWLVDLNEPATCKQVA